MPMGRPKQGRRRCSPTARGREPQRVAAEAARRLAIEEGALRVAVHRMRTRYRELLRDEIGQTLADPSWVDEELRSLQASLGG